LNGANRRRHGRIRFGRGQGSDVNPGPGRDDPRAAARVARLKAGVRAALGVLSGVMALVTLVVPLAVGGGSWRDLNPGYAGYFVANYFGYGIVLLPGLVRTHDPWLLTLVGTLGFTVDEIFAWYAGRASLELESKRAWHGRVHDLVRSRGTTTVLVLGLLPLPGIVYSLSSFAAGHFGIPLGRFFLANFTGKLVRTGVTTAAFVLWQ
jgi:membrane protein YqaA with SNARE-associated domain